MSIFCLTIDHVILSNGQWQKQTNPGIGIIDVAEKVDEPKYRHSRCSRRNRQTQVQA